MGNTSANVKVELRNFDGIGFVCGRLELESTLYLQGWAECVEASEENKSTKMDDATWKRLNHKIVAHIYMVVVNEVLGHIKGMTNGHEV
mgnify:CR=1 FL=1